MGPGAPSIARALASGAVFNRTRARQWRTSSTPRCPPGTGPPPHPRPEAVGWWSKGAVRWGRGCARWVLRRWGNWCAASHSATLSLCPAPAPPPASASTHLVPGAVLQDEAGGGGAQHARQHARCVGQPQQHAGIPAAMRGRGNTAIRRPFKCSCAVLCDCTAFQGSAKGKAACTQPQPASRTQHPPRANVSMVGVQARLGEGIQALHQPKEQACVVTRVN